MDNVSQMLRGEHHIAEYDMHPDAGWIHVFFLIMVIFF